MVKLSRLMLMLLNYFVAGIANVYTVFSFRHTWISKQTTKDYKI